MNKPTTSLSTMLLILAIVFLVTIIVITVSVAKMERDQAKDTAAQLEATRIQLADSQLQLAEAVAQLAEAKDTVKEYRAIASWYGPGFHGRRAADGSIYDQGAYTIAHKTLPFGTIVVLEYKGKRVPAMVTDRGPYIEGRDFDLSLGLAIRLGLMTKGVDEIKVYQIQVDR